MSRREKLLLLVAVLLVYLASLYALYDLGLSRTIGIRDYISDECWYISSGINVARKILGLSIVPRINSSYAEYTIVYNSSCGVDGALGVVVRYAPLALVDKVDYEKIDAFTVVVPLNETRGMEELAERVSSGGSGCVLDVFPGVLPDAENVNTYLNTEHPPLVKYVLGLLAWHYGFRFSVFRVASFAMGALGLFAIALLAYRSVALWRRAALLAIAVPLFLVVMDKAVQSMSAVAMLDIYAASLDAVAAALMAYDHGVAASVALGLAASAKYTGLFPLPGLLLYEKLRGSSTKRIVLELAIPFLVVAAFWAPFAVKKGPVWVIDEIIGAIKWHTTSRPAGGPPSTNPLGLLLGRDVFVLYYVGDKPYLEAAAHPAVTLPALVLAVFGLPGLLVAACRGRLPRWGAWSAGVAAMYLSAIGGYVATYLAGNHTLYSFYGVQLSLLSGAVLVTYYGYMLAADELAKRPIRECLCSEASRAWLPVLFTTLGIGAGLWLYGLYPVKPMLPAIEPIEAYIAGTLGGKIAKLLVIAATWLLYSAIAYRVRGPSPCIARGLGALALTWLSAGAVSLLSPAALFAPVAALIIVLEKPGIVDGLVSGALLPLPMIGLAGRNKEFMASFLTGYLAVLLLVVRTSYLVTHIHVVVAGLAAGAAAALLRDPYIRASLLATPSPSLVAANASATNRYTASSLAMAAAALVLIYSARSGAKALAPVAPIVFLAIYLAAKRRATQQTITMEEDEENIAGGDTGAENTGEE